jgi:hypothetical protein
MRRSDRPKRRTVGLRASVGSTEVSNGRLARFGRIDRSHSPRATQVSLQRLFGACLAPHLAHSLASHEGDRAAFFKNRHPMIGEPDSSGSMSSPVRSEIHGVGRSKAVLAARTGPWDHVHGYDAGNDRHIWGVGRTQPKRRPPPAISRHREVLITSRSRSNHGCQLGDYGQDR